MYNTENHLASVMLHLNKLAISKYLQSCRELMSLILEKGHSRVPVYYEQPTNIIGLILVYC